MQADKTLRIGAGKRISEVMMANKMSADLAKYDIICTIKYYEADDKLTSINKILHHALIHNEIDTASFDLSSLSVHRKKDDIVVTAISERKHTGEGLLISHPAYDPTCDLKIKPGSKVMVSTIRQGAQLLAMNPMISLVYNGLSTEAQILMFQDGKCEALLLSKTDYETINIDGSSYEFLKLHPKEMIPPPGQGITAYLAHREDLKTRRLLKNIHNADMVQISNTERKVLQLANSEDIDNIGVYCSTDQRGYFHVDAVRCDTFKKTSFSQSISAGLPEKIYASLFTT